MRGDAGAVRILAFSIGRTQELLYELEHITHRHKKNKIIPTGKTSRLLLIHQWPRNILKLIVN